MLNLKNLEHKLFKKKSIFFFIFQLFKIHLMSFWYQCNSCSAKLFSSSLKDSSSFQINVLLSQKYAAAAEKSIFLCS